MSRRLFPAVLAALCSALFLSPALAGWVEIDGEGSRTVFSAGKIKEEPAEEENWHAFDTRSGTLLLVDPHRRVYAEGKVEDYCRTLSSAAEEAFSQMSPEERALVEQLMGSAGDQAPSKVSVAIEKLGRGEEIAGFATQRYKVTVNGRPYEEVWIAPEAPVIRELNMEGLRSYQLEMSRCVEKAMPMLAEGPQPEETAEYRQLLQKGWVMRSVVFEDGEGEIDSTVASLENREIPAEEFAPPAGYRRVPVREFMMNAE